jgi:hypothetical protein
MSEELQKPPYTDKFPELDPDDVGEGYTVNLPTLESWIGQKETDKNFGLGVLHVRTEIQKILRDKGLGLFVHTKHGSLVVGHKNQMMDSAESGVRKAVRHLVYIDEVISRTDNIPLSDEDERRKLRLKNKHAAMMQGRREERKRLRYEDTVKKDEPNDTGDQSK